MPVRAALAARLIPGPDGDNARLNVTIFAVWHMRSCFSSVYDFPFNAESARVKPMWDALWLDVRLATMEDDRGAYGAIDDGALGVSDGRIVFCGRRDALPGRTDTLAREVHRLDGRWMTPGLIDCHTHLVHGGDRADEFEARLEGASYEDLLEAGHGILSTVRATRAASRDALVKAALPRLDALLAEGVTTIEIKSGYGLDLETEVSMLQAARHLPAMRPVSVVTTFLGAHALPPEFAGRRDDYVELVCTRVMPEIVARRLADAVDVFCEHIAFTAAETDRILARARSLGLPVKLHAGQLSDCGAAEVAARHGALSCDHLEFLSPSGAQAMACAGTVAVLLPGAAYMLRVDTMPPVDLMRRHNLALAVATDCNPGSSPVTSLLLMLNMASTLFLLTPEEALAGVTRQAARALGLLGDRGTLSVGKRADLAIWDVNHPNALAYRAGFNPLHAVVQGGRVATRH